MKTTTTGIFEFRFSHQNGDEDHSLPLEPSDIEGLFEEVDWGWCIADDGCTLRISAEAILIDLVTEELGGTSDLVTFFNRMYDRIVRPIEGTTQYLPAGGLR